MGNGIDSVGSTAMQSQPVNSGQRLKGMSALSEALKSGDLPAAQAAYVSLTGNSGKIGADSPLGKIGAALQAGDLGAAQKVAQAAKGGHGGHHHAHAATPPLSTAFGTGTILNTTA